MQRQCVRWVMVVVITAVAVSCQRYPNPRYADSRKPKAKSDHNRHFHSKGDYANPNSKDDDTGNPSSYADPNGYPSSSGKHDGYPSSYRGSHAYPSYYSANNAYSNPPGKNHASSYPYHGHSSSYGYTNTYHYNPYVNGDRFPDSYLEYRVDQLEKELYERRQRKHFGDPFDGLVFVDKNEILAFRATAGIGQRVFERYIDTNNNDDGDASSLAALPCGCRTPYGPCDRHFRSRILDAWPAEFFKKVRVTLYKDKKQVSFIDFDPANSTFLDYFRQERVKDSSYVDLATVNVNRFSIEGGVLGQIIRRRFYIYNATRNCNTEATIMFVVDIDVDFCHDTKGEDFPIIFYSMTNTTGVISDEDEVGFADVLAVTVVLKEHGPEHRICFP